MTDLLAKPRFLGATRRQRLVNGLLLVLMLVLPLAAWYTGNPFWLDFATRVVILSMAAVSLNFILGYGGMVSFGHAAFFGLGAYAVGIPAHHDEYGGLLHVVLAIGVGALFGAITGAVSLRTRGVHFIMITMAFAQMVYFAIVSLEEYGGDDGLVINVRSELPLIDLESNLVLFLVCFASLLAILYLVFRLVHSRFGLVIQGAKDNEQRMKAIGFHVYWYRLAAYTISGAICAYAGAMLGNFTSFISPEMMNWTRSGELIFMVILGGAGTLFGPVLGTITFIVLEEVLSGFSVYWHLPFGILLIAVVLFARGGLIGLLHGRGPRQ
ncbi:MAG: branched-chain amino acid ABC transporter permease [Burkholderiaceae bacterium]